MKATLKFNLPEEDAQFEAACNGMALAGILWDLDQWLREQQKYKEREDVPVDEVRSKLRDLMSLEGMDFDCVIWR